MTKAGISEWMTEHVPISQVLQFWRKDELEIFSFVIFKDTFLNGPNFAVIENCTFRRQYFYLLHICIVFLNFLFLFIKRRWKEKKSQTKLLFFYVREEYESCPFRIFNLFPWPTYQDLTSRKVYFQSPFSYTSKVLGEIL
jgi:hypothetical protein